MPKFTSPTVTCYYQNVRGVRTKTNDLLVSSTVARQYDIVAFTETWLNDSFSNAEIFDTNLYDVFRCDRNFEATNMERGGGVLIALDKKLNALNFDFKSNCDIFNDLIFIDIVSVRLKVKNNNYFYIFVVYIPPNTDCDNYDKLFDAIESLYIIYGSNILIIGDFNIPDFAFRNPHVTPSRNFNSISNFLNFFNFTQFNDVLNCNNRLLDLVISNCTCNVFRSSDTLLPEDQHHPPLIIETTFNCNDKEFPQKSIEGFNFKKANFPALYQELASSNWSTLNEHRNVNEAVCALYDNLNSIFVKHIPKKNMTHKYYPPWFNGEIISHVKQKTRAWKMYRLSPTDNNYNSFNRLRSTLKIKVNAAYRKYVSKAETDIKSDPKKFWSFINTKKGNTDIPLSMTYNNQYLQDPQLIVNSFADYFSSTYTNSSSFNTNEASVSNNNVLNINSITTGDVLRSIKKIKSNFTMGPDLIPAFLIRDCATLFCEPLCIIFNLVLQTCTFPDIWKVSRICPVYKKGCKTEITNHRPIAILCNFSKVFEILIHSILSYHVKNVIVPEQHGFMEGRSTVTNLVCKSQFLSEVLDRRGQVDVIYTDFSKAFDRLDHGLLLRKLDNTGFSGSLIAMIKSYLTGRSQYVQCHGYQSIKFPQTSGVPQGSILGPLMFVIFINDIATNIDVNFLLYADDLKIYCEVESSLDCVKLQESLDLIYSWCQDNHLPLNASKCNVMSYSRKNITLTHEYTLDGSILNRPYVIKDLGVIFDPKLSFASHIDATVAAAYKGLGFLVRNMKGFKYLDTLRLLFITFVRSKLEYASVVWSPIYHIHITSIERVQRRFFKSAAFVLDNSYPYRGTPQEVFYERFNMSSLINRRAMHSVILLYKIVNNTLNSENIVALLDFHVPRYSARSNHLFFVKNHRTNIYKCSPIYQMITNYASIESRLDILFCTISDIKKIYM